MLAQSNEALVYQVEHALGLLPEVNLNDLRVTAHRGRVSIQGVVGDPAGKQAAIDAARRVPGVVSVDAAIAVETPADEE